MSEIKWFRVIDPLSPLFGCDVAGCSVEKAFGTDDGLLVTRLRRIDITVGDRPFQLIAPEGRDLGLIISAAGLRVSMLQDETVELSTTRPFGLCLSEGEVTRPDGHVLKLAFYEHALQVALSSATGELLGSKVYVKEFEQQLSDNAAYRLFDGGGDIDDVIFELKRRD